MFFPSFVAPFGAAFYDANFLHGTCGLRLALPRRAQVSLDPSIEHSNRWFFRCSLGAAFSNSISSTGPVDLGLHYPEVCRTSPNAEGGGDEVGSDARGQVWCLTVPGAIFSIYVRAAG